MSDDSPKDEPVSGMDRRSMLKRTAIVGGALVWTTPIVQSVSASAFAATEGSPVPPPPDGDCADGGSADRKYSFKVEVSSSGAVSGFKDIGGSKCAPSSYNAGSTPFYVPPGTSIRVDGSTFVVVLPAGFTVSEADVKAGNGKGTDSPDGCFDVDLTDTDPAGGYEFEVTELQQDISHINVVVTGCLPT